MTTFILREACHAKAAWKFIKENAAEQARIGQPLMVTVEAHTAKRSTQANARYWAILDDIAEQAQIGGKRFSREAWHTHFRDLYAPKEDGPAGLVAMSTSQMSKTAFSDYVQRVEVFAVQTLGVELIEV